jgi:hypothetical protein
MNDEKQFFKVTITKEFIEEADSDMAAKLEAVADLQYHVDKNIHTPLSIMESLDIQSRPLTESEYQELDEAMHRT